MPREALSQAQVDDFRQRTIEVATRLFATQGYEAVTMRAIGSAMGASPMTAYRYFENKAEIFGHVRAEVYVRFADSQLAGFERSDQPLERLIHMHEAYLAFALEDPNGYRIMFQLDQAGDDAPRVQVAESGRAFGYLRDAVSMAVDAGYVIGEPLTVAHLLWAQVHGLVTLHMAGKLSHGRTLEALRNAPFVSISTPEQSQVRKS